MVEILSSYPVRKIIIEFQANQVIANGRKYRDIDELLEWIKDCEKIANNPYSIGQA